MAQLGQGGGHCGALVTPGPRPAHRHQLTALLLAGLTLLHLLEPGHLGALPGTHLLGHLDTARPGHWVLALLHKVLKAVGGPGLLTLLLVRNLVGSEADLLDHGLALCGLETLDLIRVTPSDSLGGDGVRLSYGLRVRDIKQVSVDHKVVIGPHVDIVWLVIVTDLDLVGVTHLLCRGGADILRDGLAYLLLHSVAVLLKHRAHLVPTQRHRVRMRLMDGEVIVNNEVVMVRDLMHSRVSPRKVRGEIRLATEESLVTMRRSDVRLSVVRGAVMGELYMRLRVMHLVMDLLVHFRMDLVLWSGDVRCGDLVEWFMM